jgi:hypothetical protein
MLILWDPTGTQKEWRPPEGWPDVIHCRALNKSARFQEEISAALVQHHSDASWAAAFKRPRRRIHNLFGKCFSAMARLVVEMVSDFLVVGNYGALTILFLGSRLTSFIINNNNNQQHRTWTQRLRCLFELAAFLQSKKERSGKETHHQANLSGDSLHCRLPGTSRCGLWTSCICCSCCAYGPLWLSGRQCERRHFASLFPEFGHHEAAVAVHIFRYCFQYLLQQ